MKLYNLPFYGIVYRLWMLFVHKFSWHYAPVHGPIDPGGRYQRWCQWCGMREGYAYDPRIPAVKLKESLANIDVPKDGESRKEFDCDRCGKLITGAYGSMGGNIEPYIPYRHYHLSCIPTVREITEGCYRE